ncbi:AmmeMemoRadiSam system radical SAM enzyme [Candidatus Poribacteria bacterium]|nr:AmmeMemoRadiSam system radical SAM enzyme [Candidatus Poribacteria bacterium]
MNINRRDFIKGLVGAGCAGLLTGIDLSKASAQYFTRSGNPAAPTSDDEHVFFVKEAMFYEDMGQKEVRCKLCPKECEVGDRERGWCGVRENRDGVYYTLVYGNPCSAYPDPIEKKPFFHFMPGTWAFSIATAGCNLNCKFCQNWEISQSRPEETKNFQLPPADIVATAKDNNCKSIAYTYTEPTVFYEYMLDTSKQARKAGLKSAVISAGYINPEPLEMLCENVDAVKIDLKSLRNKFYNDVCEGELQPVLDTLKILRDSGVWYEIVYLVVPTLNDSEQELKDTAKWVYENLGPDVPLHFSRFYPMYQLRNLPPTDPKKLTDTRKMAMDIGLNYVYIGNVAGDEGESTYCPICGELVIKRVRYFIRQNDLVDGRCKYCGEEISGIWN